MFYVLALVVVVILETIGRNIHGRSVTDTNQPLTATLAMHSPFPFAKMFGVAAIVLALTCLGFPFFDRLFPDPPTDALRFVGAVVFAILTGVGSAVSSRYLGPPPRLPFVWPSKK